MKWPIVYVDDSAEAGSKPINPHIIFNKPKKVVRRSRVIRA